MAQVKNKETTSQTRRSGAGVRSKDKSAVSARGRMTLEAAQAADVMTPRPVSIRGKATVREAIALLLDKGFSAAPVIDNSGRPIGVVSRSDIVAHDREVVHHLSPTPEYYDAYELQNAIADGSADQFQVEDADQTVVEEIMTPVVYSVAPDANLGEVVALLLAKHVHRLFVVDGEGVLVGVISTLDVLRQLRECRD